MKLYDLKLARARRTPLAGALLLILGSMGSQLASAATVPVTNCQDTGSGSLREAIAKAQSGDTVDMSALTCSTVSLRTGLVVMQDDLVMRGPGADHLTIDTHDAAWYQPPPIEHSGTGTFQLAGLRIFFYDMSPRPKGITSKGTVSLESTEIMGFKTGVNAKNVSVRNSTFMWNSVGIQASGGYVVVSASTFSHNTNAMVVSSKGDQSVLISNSTISGNSYAGQINGAATTIANSTIAFNKNFNSPSTSGELKIDAAQVTIQSSIFANNAVRDLVVTGTNSIAGDHNLVMASDVSAPLPADTISADPKLLALADNGGPTRTHALGPDSPAIDAGDNPSGLASDQRGLPRQRGARPDIGAYEFQSGSTVPMIGPAYTGSWYDPNQSGHGVIIEVLDGKRFLAYWFTFNPGGTQQAWFTGVGTYENNTATVTQTEQPTGGRWIPNFDPTQVIHQPWGTLKFTFTDCTHGRVDFASTFAGYGSGHMDLTRLTLPAGLTCP